MGSAVNSIKFLMLGAVVILGLGVVLAQETKPAEPAAQTDTEKIYKIGHGVSPPRPIETKSPQLSDEEKSKAERAKSQGTVVLWAIVGEDGKVKDVRVSRSLNKDLDKKAVEAVKKWIFNPAKKDGKPVAVQINIEVNFKLY